MPRQPPFDGAFDDTQEPLPRPNGIQDFDPLYDYHRLTRDLPQGPDYPADEPDVSVKYPAKRSAPPEFRSLQTPARDEISRAVQDAVLSKHQRNATDNVGPDAKPQAGDDELKNAQSSDRADRNAYQLAHSLDVAASLMSGRHGKVDDSYYNNLINNANVNEKQVLSRRNEKRAGEDQTLQMKLGDQSVEKNDRSLARDATEEDKTSSLSEGARGIIARIIPKIATDPSFRNMSAKDIREQFPMLSKEIDELKAAEHEKNENARNRDDNSTRVAVARIGQSQRADYNEALASHMRNQDALRASELSGRSYQNLVPVPGRIPVEADRKAASDIAENHDVIDGLVGSVLGKYRQYGPQRILDEGRDGLQGDLEQLRIRLNVADKQGAISHGDYERMMKIVTNPDQFINAARPEYFENTMQGFRATNDRSFHSAVRSHNYISRGEPDFDDAASKNAVPTVAPAPKTPLANPASGVSPTSGSGSQSSSGGRVSVGGPVAPGGMILVTKPGEKMAKRVRVEDLDAWHEQGWNP